METYDVECGCGEVISVAIQNCGSDVPCPRCRSMVCVPDSVTLKAQNADPYPSLRNIQKIQCAINDRIDPFDGRCVACRSAGTNEIPVIFSELVERIIDDDGGFRLGITGVKAVVGDAESVIETTRFPIILCDQCTYLFNQSRPSRYRPWAKRVLFSGIVAAVFQVVFQEWLASVLATLVLLGFLSRFRRTGIGKRSEVPNWFEKWIQSIRWFPEATRDAMEFDLTIGAARRISRE